MASEDHTESSEKHRSAIIAYEIMQVKPTTGSGRVPRRMNDIVERSVTSVNEQKPEQRRSEVRAIELLWARLNDGEKREFEQKREDEKRNTPDASDAMAQSIITESKRLSTEKERREAKIKKYARVTASEENELKDQKKRALKGVKKIVDEAILEENGLDNDKQKAISDRMKQVAESAAELQKIKDEDQGFEKRMNQIMEIDGAEGLEELEIMNKFYKHQIIRLQNMNRRYRERKELAERINRAIDVGAKGEQEAKNLRKLDAYETKELEDQESNYTDGVESLVDGNEKNRG